MRGRGRIARCVLRLFFFTGDDAHSTNGAAKHDQLLSRGWFFKAISEIDRALGLRHRFRISEERAPVSLSDISFFLLVNIV